MKINNEHTTPKQLAQSIIFSRLADLMEFPSEFVENALIEGDQITEKEKQAVIDQLIKITDRCMKPTGYSYKLNNTTED